MRVQPTEGHDDGVALVRRAGVRGLPVDFDGAALLRDLREADSVYRLANEGLDSFFVTQTKVLEFDRVVAAMARAREALCRIVQSPTFSSVLFNALACVSTEDIDRGASPLQSFKAGKSLRLPPELKGMERIDALIWELTALIIAGNEGSRVLQAQQQKTPELRGSLRLGPSTPWEHFIASMLPTVFEKHLGRFFALWTGDTGTSTGIRLVQVALEHLGYKRPGRESVKKARQRYQLAAKRGARPSPEAQPEKGT